MKKLLITCLVLFLFSCAAIADDNLPEINFRGLKLGATASEVFAILGDTNPSLSNGRNYCSYAPINVAGNSIGLTVPDDSKNNEMAILEYCFNNKELAGHECWETRLYFVKPVVDGSLVENEMDSVFYAGTYALDNSAKDDIKAKLTELYGKPEKGKHNKKESYTWYGKNNVAIYMTEDSEIRNYLGISYAWLGFEEVFKETCTYLEENCPAKDTSSTVGL